MKRNDPSDSFEHGVSHCSTPHRIALKDDRMGLVSRCRRVTANRATDRPIRRSHLPGSADPPSRQNRYSKHISSMRETRMHAGAAIRCLARIQFRPFAAGLR